MGVRALWPKAAEAAVGARLGLHAGGMLLWFAALPTVAISEITAIGFAGPIFICLGAVLFLNERMTGARWAAVLVGFSGVLLVLNPFGAGGFSGISTGMLLMLASGPVFAAFFLVAKVLTRHERSEVMVLWQHLVVSMLLLPFAVVPVGDALAGPVGPAAGLRLPRRGRALLHDARVPRRRHLGGAIGEVPRAAVGGAARLRHVRHHAGGLDAGRRRGDPRQHAVARAAESRRIGRA